MEGADVRNDVRQGQGCAEPSSVFGSHGWKSSQRQSKPSSKGASRLTAPALLSRPSGFRGLQAVGEGVALDLIPDDPKTWEWWGDFESELEVRRRPRFSREWHDVKSPSETENWLRSEAHRYLRHLQGAASAGH